MRLAVVLPLLLAGCPRAPFLELPPAAEVGMAQETLAWAQARRVHPERVGLALSRGGWRPQPLEGVGVVLGDRRPAWAAVVVDERPGEHGACRAALWVAQGEQVSVAQACTVGHRCASRCRVAATADLTGDGREEIVVESLLHEGGDTVMRYGVWAVGTDGLRLVPAEGDGSEAGLVRAPFARPLLEAEALSVVGYTTASPSDGLDQVERVSTWRVEDGVLRRVAWRDLHGD